MAARLLIAEDDPFNRRLLRELCEAAGHEVEEADDGRAALAIARRDPPPDLVLLDLSMPGVDGLTILRTLRESDATRNVPVVLVTASGDQAQRALGFEAGADDFVSKPFRVFELQQRIEQLLRRGHLDDDNEPAADSSDAVDPLTRAGTARQLRIGLDYEFRRATRYDHPLSCIVLTIDNLQTIADAQGREQADGILVSLVHGIRGFVRSIDHIYRSDADEFTVLLPQTDLAGARNVADRLANGATQGSIWSVPVAPTPVLRIGIGSRDETTQSPEDLLRTAVDQIRRERRIPTLRPSPESEPP
ncbi:MAG: response regulator [Deltaproteobacteria bacterium]|nr:response regulator [Deltaproteobacteria bacterium]